MAYADGELDGELALEVERAVARDKALAERVALFEAAKSLTVKAMTPLLNDEIPPSLAKRVAELADQSAAAEKAKNVYELARRRVWGPPRQSWQLPLAASLALAIGGLGGFLASRPVPPQTAGLRVGATVDLFLAQALNSTAQGKSQTLGEHGTLKAIASFLDADGTFCREFEHDQSDGSAIVAVACHRENQWQLRIAVASNQDAAEFAPASSLESIEAYLNATGAGAALSVAEEEARLKELAEKAQ